MAPPWQTTSKTIANITVSRRGRVTQLGHAPPAPPTALQIHPQALALAIASCSALARTSQAVIAGLTLSKLAILEVLVDDILPAVGVTSDYRRLVDFNRTTLSGDLGAGVTHLVMQSMGYGLRDLAKPYVSRGRAGDLLYTVATGGPGVVMAEAKGQIGVVTPAAVQRSAETGYDGQVDRHVGARSSIGRILHGYAVAVGTIPAGGRRTIDAFIHLAESSMPAAVLPASRSASDGRLGAPRRRARAPTKLALGNFRAAFSTIGAVPIAEHISRRLKLSSATASHPVEFDRLQVGTRRFLIARGAPGSRPRPQFQTGFEHKRTVASYFFPWIWPHAIEESAADLFLRELVRTAEDDRGIMQLSSFEPELGGGDAPYILFADGLAALRDPGASTFLGKAEWRPGEKLKLG